MTHSIVRPTQEADADEIVEIMYLVSPEYPRITGDELLARVKSLPGTVPRIRFVAEEDDTIVGYGNLVQQFWTDSATSFRGHIVVHPHRMGQGIGSQLHEYLVKMARELSAEHVYGEIRDDRPQALTFAERRGWTPTGLVTRMSRLDVRSAALDGYGELRDRLKGQGISVMSLADVGTDTDRVLREAHGVELEYAEDIPASQPFSVTFEQWHELIFSGQGMSPNSFFVARADSRVIGTATLKREGESAAAHSGMGVLREYRGRGVARLLKLQQIAWAQTKGLDYLYTGNDINNPRMYEINMRLGYEPLASEIEVVRSGP